MIVYTVIFNDFDVLLPPLTRHEKVRYVCVTDRLPPSAEGWEIRCVDLPISAHPFAQRWYKVLSHRVFPDEDVTLYLDENLQLRVDPLGLADEHLKDADIALFEHPERNGVYEELAACARLKKDRRHILDEAAARYRREGVPEHGYLHAAGLILRRHSSDVIKLNELWMEELMKTSIRDQPALAFALWKTGVQPSTIKANVWRNEIVGYSAHKAKHLLDDRTYLFVCGNPRSGTTALCDLLNEDPRMVVGKERYRRVRAELRPEHFLPKRFFEPTPRETTFLPNRLIPTDRPGFQIWPEDEAALKTKWASPQLTYVGDKSPFYIRQLPYLHRMFPGAQFVVALRDPVSVADSYQRRAVNRDDHWPAENDYKVALDHWNQSVTDLLGYLDEFGLSDLFLIDYDSFFSGDTDYLRSLYSFLELDLEKEVAARFEAMTRDWGGRARPHLLSAGMEQEIRDGANWDGYWALKRLVPLMRDYRLLSAEGRQIDLLRRRLNEQTDRYGEVVELARTLYAKLGRIAAGSSSIDKLEVDDLWCRFWSLNEQGE